MKKMNLLAAAIAALGMSGAAQATVYAFIQMPLTASQEGVTLPTPATAPDTTAYGRITAMYDDVTKVLTYNVVWQLKTGAVPRTNAGGNNHLHGPAPVGTSAGIAIPIPDLPLTNSGSVTNSITLTAAQVTASEADLLAGRMYYNIHSTLFNGGEIRGQMIQNGSTAVGSIFQNPILTVPSVLVPGLSGTQSYNAELNFTNGTFTLTGNTTPLR